MIHITSQKCQSIQWSFPFGRHDHIRVMRARLQLVLVLAERARLRLQACIGHGSRAGWEKSRKVATTAVTNIAAVAAATAVAACPFRCCSRPLHTQLPTHPCACGCPAQSCWSGCRPAAGRGPSAPSGRTRTGGRPARGGAGAERDTRIRSRCTAWNCQRP